MSQYYLDDWDSDDLDDRSARRKNKLVNPRKREKLVVTIAKELPDVDRARPVCEIGSGWGVSLKHLLDGGFAKVVGTEASRHRAQVIEQALGVPMLTAPFESEAARPFLAAYAPYAVIVSNHAIEHTSDPSAVIAAASSVQRAGDYLIVAVPNQQTEPPMSVFFFLPHLHSFTPASLARVAARHGYVVADDRHLHPKQVLLVFKKSGEQAPAPLPGPNPFENALARYEKAFGFDRWRFGLRRVWWPRRGGPTGQRWMMGLGGFEQRRWARAVERESIPYPRSVAVRSLRKRHTSAEESPIEIQFKGPLILFCK